ncbi:MAG TPA: DUF4334 domain-containing protein [Nannocystis sp.]
MRTALLHDLLGGDAIVPVAAILARFDDLAAIETAFLHGAWAGGLVRTGHPSEPQLEAVRWAGKIFHEDDDVDPIVVLDAEGRRVVSPMMGKARLRMVRHRGVVTATMIYDKHPIFDHFRKVDEDTVLGVMDRKGDAAPLCFWLRRLPAGG